MKERKDNKIIRLEQDTFNRLKELKKYILKYGIDHFNLPEDYELKSLSQNLLIKMLLDVFGFV